MRKVGRVDQSCLQSLDQERIGDDMREERWSWIGRVCGFAAETKGSKGAVVRSSREEGEEGLFNGKETRAALEFQPNRSKHHTKDELGVGTRACQSVISFLTHLASSRTMAERPHSLVSRRHPNPLSAAPPHKTRALQLQLELTIGRRPYGQAACMGCIFERKAADLGANSVQTISTQRETKLSCSAAQFKGGKGKRCG